MTLIPKIEVIEKSMRVVGTQAILKNKRNEIKVVNIGEINYYMKSK